MSLRVTLQAALPDFVLDVAFETSASGIAALFGPSGAGKSLTLRHLAGLERADRGRIHLGERQLLDVETGLFIRPQERRIGLVFQEYALFPHLDVRANIAFGLHAWERDARRQRVTELLGLMGLEGYERRSPRSLSGGERQRVALARALAPEPELLLLDEPFAALDFRVRGELRRALGEIQRLTSVPMILVTHALDDVKALADTLVLMDRGSIVAVGPTNELLQSPPSPEAASLVGVGSPAH